MINLIQVLLAAGIIITGVYSYQRLKSSYLDAVLIFIFMAIGLLFVFWPELTTRVAKLIGVGRGADMIFYLSIVFFAFLIMKLYARTRRLEQMITKIIRDESLRNAAKGEDSGERI